MEMFVRHFIFQAPLIMVYIISQVQVVAILNKMKGVYRR
jgi:hypothetical protein